VTRPAERAPDTDGGKPQVVDTNTMESRPRLVREIHARVAEMHSGEELLVLCDCVRRDCSKIVSVAESGGGARQI
jgi:hypothetical protein